LIANASRGNDANQMAFSLSDSFPYSKAKNSENFRLTFWHFVVFSGQFGSKIWKLALGFKVGSSPHFCIARFGSSCTLSISRNMHPQPGP